MNTSIALKILSILGGIAGILAACKQIPGVSINASVAIIGVSAIVFKIVDLVEGVFFGGSQGVKNPAPAAVVALLFCGLVFGLAACGTTPTTATDASLDRAAQSALYQSALTKVPGDVSAILRPLLVRHPGYAADVLWLGVNLPTLVQNGPIDATAITAAIQKIPGISASEAADLGIAGPVLDVALMGYTAYSGNVVALYSDPNITALVSAFSSGLSQAAAGISPATSGPGLRRLTYVLVP